jgi:hypothetical protein
MFTVDEIFVAACAISRWRAESACYEWNQLQGSQQQTTLALANDSSNDLDSVASDFMNRLINPTIR